MFKTILYSILALAVLFVLLGMYWGFLIFLFVFKMIAIASIIGYLLYLTGRYRGRRQR